MKYKKGDFGYDGSHITYTPEIYRELKKDYWDVEVDAELRKMELWLLSHPLKKDWRRFVCNWLSRADKKKAVPFNKEPSYKPRPGGKSEPKEVCFLNVFEGLKRRFLPNDKE